MDSGRNRWMLSTATMIWLVDERKNARERSAHFESRNDWLYPRRRGRGYPRQVSSSVDRREFEEKDHFDFWFQFFHEYTACPPRSCFVYFAVEELDSQNDLFVGVGLKLFVVVVVVVAAAAAAASSWTTQGKKMTT